MVGLNHGSSTSRPMCIKHLMYLLPICGRDDRLSLSVSLWTAERVPLERKHGEVVEVVPLHGEKTLDILQYLAIFPMVLLCPSLCLTVLYEVSLQELLQ